MILSPIPAGRQSWSLPLINVCPFSQLHTSTDTHTQLKLSVKFRKKGDMANETGLDFSQHLPNDHFPVHWWMYAEAGGAAALTGFTQTVHHFCSGAAQLWSVSAAPLSSSPWCTLQFNVRWPSFLLLHLLLSLHLFLLNWISPYHPLISSFAYLVLKIKRRGTLIIEQQHLASAAAEEERERRLKVKTSRRRSSSCERREELLRQRFFFPLSVPTLLLSVLDLCMMLLLLGQRCYFCHFRVPKRKGKSTSSTASSWYSHTNQCY